MSGSDAEPDLAVGPDAFVDAGAGQTVAVVGAGAVGATVSYDLARQGAEVTLYDRGPIAGGATGRAAGICFDAFADSRDAEIAGESIERFRAFAGDDTFDFHECPYVWFAREGDDAAATIAEQVTRMQDHGVVAVEMDGDALGERFPALAVEDVAAAGVAGAAGYVDPTAYTACLAAAADGAGATLAPETPVTVRSDPPQVVVDGDRERSVDAVVVTAGAHTGALLGEVGIDLATKPYRVQALTASVEGDRSFAEPMWYDGTDDVYVRPHADGLLAGDGTIPEAADPDDWERDADPGFGTDLLDRVSRRLPGLDGSLERSWAGLCTATPDRDPLVGPVADGLYVATGFQGEGFMRAPAIGRRLADLVLGVSEAEAVGLAPYDPRRFDGDESFEIAVGFGDGGE